MTRILELIIIIILLTGVDNKLYSQNNQYDQGKVSYVTVIDYQFITQIDKITDFPQKIVRTANDVIQKSIGDHGENFTFKSGSIFNVKAYFKKYPDMLNQTQAIIPSYVLYYNWSDPSIGIKNNEIYLCLDKLGQVIYFNFPRHYDFSVIKLETFDNALAISDSIIHNDSIKYGEPDIFLDFNECKRDLAWTFRFSELSDTVFHKTKEIKIYLIDKEIEIDEIEYESLGIIDDRIIEEEKIEDLIKRKNNRR